MIPLATLLPSLLAVFLLAGASMLIAFCVRHIASDGLSRQVALALGIALLLAILGGAVAYYTLFLVPVPVVDNRVGNYTALLN
jgi:hypothetical protein